MNYHIEILESFYKLKNIHFTKLLPKEISHGECFALMKLKQLIERDDKGCVTVADLCTRLHVSSPALSRTLKHLEEEEYVKRIKDPKDRRNNFLLITDKGNDILQNVEEHMDVFCNAIYSSMGEGSVNNFIQFLNDLYVITSEEIEKIERKGDKNEQKN